MAISLLRAGATKSRRIRCFFSNTLAAGAFTPGLYTVTSLDPGGASPTINAVYAVLGQPAVCELVLAQELADGTRYTVAVAGVPATDASTATGSENIYYGSNLPALNAEPVVNDGDVVLYGRDIIYTGIDFQETSDGDLAVLSGASNAALALQRRVLGSPLPYNAGYSPDARSFVDGNDASILKNRVIQQVLRDDRVQSVTVTVTANDDGNPIFLVSPVLIGGKKPPPIPVSVKT